MKMEEKTKQKQGGTGVADTMKMAWKVGSVKKRKTVTKAAARRDRREAGRVDCDI